jgi:hypothetical protein
MKHKHLFLIGAVIISIVAGKNGSVDWLGETKRLLLRRMSR